jgi:hypothetical protein
MEPEFVGVVTIGDRVVAKRRFTGRDAATQAAQWSYRKVYGSRVAIVYDEQEFPILQTYMERGVQVTRMGPTYPDYW